MDRKSLVFIVLIAAAFLGINIYFQSQKDSTARVEQKRALAAKALEPQITEAERIKRLVNIDDLSLVYFYTDETSKTPVGSGFKMEQGIATIAWDSSMPETLLAQAPGETILQKVTLQNKGKLPKGSLALYAQAPFVETAYNLPTNTDIQLLTLGETPEVFLGRYDGAKFLSLGSMPTSAALALVPGSSVGSKQKYTLVGLYQPRQKSVIALEFIPSIEASIAVVRAPLSSSTVSTEEEFYVLETDTLQLVFSNIGGSLAEINMPFKTDACPNSVVLPIEFDDEMAKKHPYNDQFPSASYYKPDSNGKGKIFVSKTTLGGYSPLIRRNLIEAPPFRNVKVPYQYYALNITSDYPEMATLAFKVKEFDKNHIVFEAIQPQRRITKTYTIATFQNEAIPYSFQLEIKIDGDARGLYLTSGVPEVELISGSAAPILKYRMTKKGSGSVEKIDLPKDGEVFSLSSISPDWICNSNGYFGLIINPLNEANPAGFKAEFVSGKAAPTRIIEIDQENDVYSPEKFPGYAMYLPLQGGGQVTTFNVYAGPFDERVLSKVDEMLSDKATGYSPDYMGSITFHGWFSFISEPFSKLLFFLMKGFYWITNSWGFSIILLTVALRVMLYPLNSWSMKSMRRMQLIAPEVTAIQEKHKKDPKLAQMEIMGLYRQRGVNPFTGCLPLLIQMPFLIGMFDLLKSAFPLRGAPFIPGWIDNLTAPDVLFSWSYPIFFIGTQFHLLPLLLGAVMYLQQNMTSSIPKDKNLMTDQQKQQRFMGNIMALVFTVMFYKFPSGLNLYWLSSMLLGMLQQWYINKHFDKKKLGLNEPIVKVAPDAKGKKRAK